ncbi:MAG TPA: phosphoribosylglycinamide formyltransferase [Chlorobaculum sp.]|uniref:Phosphoribosylglycinamide formyltransferase n=1 Tax=Chlorobaculum tepidum (strain ATCC 49652 / DSM 12025 / NBRC 103806 / TLS) TaxID=194439 RepID=Q8KFK7_CHLTE|nr:phosphoribosylglycinamide formyltransferase [Chlorobaculum tepidum]AAM71565.1 phosphoribosylglycinamide formyltransferase [Chlorobaculum tepidum TLS]HBU23792.1 phosphoribosylglycinamide formyltransferase [Chlorobaculum sp.]
MIDKKKRLAVFCSGTGSNFKALFHAIIERELPAEIVMCLSNRSQCGAIDFAKEYGIETLHLSESQFGSHDDFARAMLSELRDRQIDMILLAGYLRKIPDAVIAAYPEKIVNIHPSLLPQFGGHGMYGMRVHEAVIASGETRSGATVHFVNEEYDKGRIIMQNHVPVLPGDTPKTLAERVLRCEHRLYPAALEKLLDKQP